MPILIDLSQVAISNLMMSPNIKTGDVDENLIKHMVLNSIRAYKQKFGKQYGQIVICCDSKHYWRKDIFPHYKAARKAKRESSVIEWKDVFNAITRFKNELKECFPYKVLEIHGAEADDIIAVIAKNETSPTLIIGGDKDYCQLQSKPNVKQYSPTKKKFIDVADPVAFLNELIITGDKADGIPNIKSDSDTFVKNKRQTPIRKSDLASWKKLKPDQFCENRRMLENHTRNKQLIDFNHIPATLEQEILEYYSQPALGSKAKVMQYFMDNRMRMLLRDLDQF